MYIYIYIQYNCIVYTTNRLYTYMYYLYLIVTIKVTINHN